MTGFLTGLATAMVTPFHEGGVNFASFGRMIDYQIANGADALVVLGTTGEPSAMSEKERDETVCFALERAGGRAKVIVGTGGNCTERAVAHTRRAKELGADGALCVTPYYNKCTQNGLYLYYRALCEVGLPVIAYNVPSRTGVNLLPETALRLAELEPLAGIKEASGNMAQVMETAWLIRGKCDLYSGEDALNLPILAAGGTAVISVVSNLAPKAVKSLVSAVLKGDLPAAREIDGRLAPLTKACFCEVNPIPVKEGLNLLGFEAGDPRPPLTPLEEAHKILLKRALEEFGGKTL